MTKMKPPPLINRYSKWANECNLNCLSGCPLLLLHSVSLPLKQGPPLFSRRRGHYYSLTALKMHSNSCRLTGLAIPKTSRTSFFFFFFSRNVFTDRSSAYAQVYFSFYYLKLQHELLIKKVVFPPFILEETTRFYLSFCSLAAFRLHASYLTRITQ